MGMDTGVADEPPLIIVMGGGSGRKTDDVLGPRRESSRRPMALRAFPLAARRGHFLSASRRSAAPRTSEAAAGASIVPVLFF